MVVVEDGGVKSEEEMPRRLQTIAEAGRPVIIVEAFLSAE